MNFPFFLYVASIILFAAAAAAAFSSDFDVSAIGLAAVGLACYVASKYPNRGP